MIEQKEESLDIEDECLDDDVHYQSEHYLKVNKRMSKSKFTAIDVLSPEVSA